MLLAVALFAQFKNGGQTTLLDIPRVSQRAVVTQRVGMTDVTVVYHRPQAKGRAVFGEIVPYDEVWRAGANDNTTIEFTDPVTIEGQPLPAGRYGLHMIPSRSDWTIIFSKNSTSWGSFSYDPKEDALRVKVKPSTTASRDLLTYDFTDVAPDRATLVLEWGDVAVPVRIGVDTPAITVVHMQEQLRHLPGFEAEAWRDAVLYLLDSETDYPLALQWIDRAIQMEGENFDNLDEKAQVLTRLGRTSEAADFQAKAFKVATPAQVARVGTRWINEKRVDDAAALYKKLTAEHADLGSAWYGLARVQSLQGDRAGAKQSLEKAIAHARNPPQRQLYQSRLAHLDNGQGLD